MASVNHQSRCRLPAGLIPLALGLLLAAAAQALPTPGERCQEIDREQAALQLRHQKKEKELRRLSASIARLKAKRLNIVGHYQLDSYLLQAKDLSEELSKLQGQSLALQQERRQMQREWLEYLDREADQLAQQILSRPAGRTEATALAEALQANLAQRQKISPPPDSASAASHYWPDFDRQSDDRHSLAQKISYYKEQEQALLQAIEESHQQLALWQKRVTLAREVRHFLDEETFFGETGFARGPGETVTKTKDGSGEVTLAAKTQSLSRSHSNTQTPGGKAENGDPGKMAGTQATAGSSTPPTPADPSVHPGEVPIAVNNPATASPPLSPTAAALPASDTISRTAGPTAFNSSSSRSSSIHTGRDSLSLKSNLETASGNANSNVPDRNPDRAFETTAGIKGGPPAIPAVVLPAGEGASLQQRARELEQQLHLLRTNLAKFLAGARKSGLYSSGAGGD